MGFSGSYGGGEQMAQKMVAGAGNTPHAFTLKDRVNAAITESERRLAAAKRADEILQANPQLEELLNLLQQF